MKCDAAACSLQRPVNYGQLSSHGCLQSDLIAFVLIKKGKHKFKQQQIDYISLVVYLIFLSLILPLPWPESLRP
jgi:hypothetical protein